MPITIKRYIIINVVFMYIVQCTVVVRTMHNPNMKSDTF